MSLCTSAWATVALLTMAVTAAGCVGRANALNKYESSAGFYYPLNTTTPTGETMQDAFRFGVNAVRMVADPGYGGWPWGDAVKMLCNVSQQVFSAVLPPSEGAMENNPTDNDPWHPAAKPGMVQAAQRMANLSRLCPQAAGVIIDDFCQHANPAKPRQRCHKVSLQGMQDIKGALLGKPVDPVTGKVDHSAPATTPHLQLWVIMYGQQLALNYTIDANQIELIDGVSLWQDQQPETGTPEGTVAVLDRASRVWPTLRVQSGTDLAFSTFGWAPTQTVRDVLTTSLRAVRNGTVDAALLFDANDLRKGVINASHWRDLALPALLDQELWAHSGEGVVVTDPPAPGAVVAVVRLAGGREVSVTRKFANASGAVSFGSMEGPHRVTVTLDGGRNASADVTVVAQQTTVVRVRA